MGPAHAIAHKVAHHGSFALLLLGQEYLLQRAFAATPFIKIDTRMITFDANLKGSRFLHCHHLYHMATGMMTEVSLGIIWLLLTVPRL